MVVGLGVDSTAVSESSDTTLHNLVDSIPTSPFQPTANLLSPGIETASTAPRAAHLGRKRFEISGEVFRARSRWEWPLVLDGFLPHMNRCASHGNSAGAEGITIFS